MKEDICKEWKISSEEYEKLDIKFGKLIEHQSWDLIRRNNRTNFTDEQVDIAQNLRIALMKAGSYYKRQVYIEKCLFLCEKYSKDLNSKKKILLLKDLWNNKTRHGANKQKFGPIEEKKLELLLNKVVPKSYYPDKAASLKIDSKFIIYCKSITWNEQKTMGKKITREKSIRENSVSLSDFDYMASM
jgi:hypothetical protein